MIDKLDNFMFAFDFFFADGSSDEGMFPLAALLTGALLTIGVAVLLIVVLAVKKNREQSQPHENGVKEKHIGGMTIKIRLKFFEIKYLFFRYGYNRYNSSGNERGPTEVRRRLHAQRQRETT